MAFDGASGTLICQSCWTLPNIWWVSSWSVVCLKLTKNIFLRLPSPIPRHHYSLLSRLSCEQEGNIVPPPPAPPARPWRRAQIRILKGAILRWAFANLSTLFFVKTRVPAAEADSRRSNIRFFLSRFQAEYSKPSKWSTAKFGTAILVLTVLAPGNGIYLFKKLTPFISTLFDISIVKCCILNSVNSYLQFTHSVAFFLFMSDWNIFH